MASNVAQVTVISGWNSLFGTMGPKGYVQHQDLVMGSMPGAQWVQADHLRGSFLALKSPCRRGLSGTFLASNVTQMTVIFIYNDSYGSVGPMGHAGHLDSVMGAMSSP